MLEQILAKFSAIASNPSAQKERYLKEGKKVVLTAPVYTPEEIVHSMGMVPRGAWGGDVELKESKKYFPAFICSIAQSIVELGAQGAYEGASAIIIPSLCDSLKVLGQNWKYAVPSIPFIPMTYPQNRKTDFGKTFTIEGYRRVIADLEKYCGVPFEEEKLAASIEVYNRHNAVMREAAALLASHPEISPAQRSAVFKSAFFLRKEEHTALVEELLSALKEAEPGKKKISIMTSGILADAPALLEILTDSGFHVVADDIAAESRQYRTDAPEKGTALERLADKYCAMDGCSVLYDPKKGRVNQIVADAKAAGAEGLLIVLTKFCDPEEFDLPLIKNACEAADLPCTLIEVDRQMVNYEQARTAIETFRDLLTF